MPLAVLETGKAGWLKVGETGSVGFQGQRG